jgi:hypothetical protein
MTFSLATMATKIQSSHWWKRAAISVDSHYSNESGVMLSDHLLAVQQNIAELFRNRNEPFHQQLFALLPKLGINKSVMGEELQIVALLHDIGKPTEDKQLIIPHPITGKPAHKRHGLVGLMAAMEILGEALHSLPEKRMRIYRTIELHDMSYGLFREYSQSGELPADDKWDYINNKVFPVSGVGLYYLLLFKLADVHGHGNLSDVIWFFETVGRDYFQERQLVLPVPTERDIRY